MAAGNSGSGGATPRFEFATAQRIVFGVGASRELPAVVAHFGGRVLWVGGTNPRRHGTLLAAVEAAAERVELLRVAGEPTVAAVETGAALARAFGAQVVVAVGGGSAIDAGKAIAALATNAGPPLDYLEVVGKGAPLTVSPLPFIAVPTTAGTGAEVTRNAVLSVPEAKVKVSLRSAEMLPRVALVDPGLAMDLPANVTATTGMDALTQLIEPYLSCRANPLTDSLCRDGIPMVARALRRVVANRADPGARSDLALGALYSGMALANAGLGAVHGFAGPIGGMFPAPHGALCAALLGPVLRANLAALRSREPNHPAIDRLREVAGWLTGNSGDAPEGAAAACDSLAADLDIPRLSAWGIGRDDICAIVAKAEVASSMKGNPTPLHGEELAVALAAAL